MNKRAFALFVVSTFLFVGVVTTHAQGGAPACDPTQQTCPQTTPTQGGGRGNGQGGGQGGQVNGKGRQNGGGITANLPPASVKELPQEIIDLMIAGWEDEQLAYATYEGVISQFGEVAPFVNIQQAEAQHSAAWEALFQRYGVTLPEVPTVTVPTFASLAEACQAGANAEIANIALYDKMLTAFTPYPDVYQVAVALRDASQNKHLPAFQRCAK